MLNGLKNLFGGQAAMLQMVKPMLPKIIADTKPAIKTAYQQKILELENGLDYELANEDEFRQEIAPFIVIRGGEFQANWCVLDHQVNEIGEWEITVSDTLESITLDEILQSVLAETDQPTEPKQTFELPEPQQKEGTLLERAGVTEKPTIEQKIIERHNKYAAQRFVAVQVGKSLQVIEGPAPEGETVYYGHNDQEICQNWVDEANRKGGLQL